MIESPKNERIRHYRRLRKKNFRYREGKFLVEGFQCVGEALTSGFVPECLICNEKGSVAIEAYADIIRERSIAHYIATDEVISSLTATVTPQGVIAVVPMLHRDLEGLLEDEPHTLLVANKVRDPGNLGNMIRIADAAGAGGMLVCAQSVDPYNPKTVRSTAGSLFHIPMSVGEEVSETIAGLKRKGYAVYAADAHNGTCIWEMEWPQKLALVMGNEAWGLGTEAGLLADELVRVEVFGKAESLNVAAATAVILYEVRRRRSEGGYSIDGRR